MRFTGVRPLRLSEALIFAYWSVIALLILVRAAGFESGGEVAWLLLGHGMFLCGAYWFFRRLRALPGRTQTLGRWIFVLASMPIAFMLLGRIIPSLNPLTYELGLTRLDIAIFGANPQEWVEGIYNPLLTELLQIAYTSYYFLPIVLFIVLWRRGRYNRAEELLTALLLGFWTSYLGYILVPAISPYRWVEMGGAGVITYTKELEGLLLQGPIHRILHELEGVHYDCFPSGHTEIALIVLVYAWRWARRTFWVLLPFGAGLIASTVYLRYHYVVDLVAGALLAWAVVRYTPRWFAWWNARRGIDEDADSDRATSGDPASGT